MDVRYYMAACMVTVTMTASSIVMAGWEFHDIDTGFVYNLMAEGDYVAYTKRIYPPRHVFTYQISSGRIRDITEAEPLCGTDNSLVAMKNGIIWFESSYGDPYSESAIYRHDIQTAQTVLLCRGNNQFVRFIGLYTTTPVVEMSDDCWLCDEGQMERLTFEASSLRWFRLVSGEHLLWSDNDPSSNKSRLYQFAIPTRALKLIDSSTSGCSYRLIADREHVAWFYHRFMPPDADGRLCYYNVTSGEKRLIDTSEHSLTNYLYPQIAIEYPKVAYVKEASSRWYLVLYDIETGAKRILAGSTMRIHSPYVNGTHVFYLTENCPEDECRELNHFDLTTSRSQRITTYGVYSFVEYPTRISDGVLSFVRGTDFGPYDHPVIGFNTAEPVCGVLSRRTRNEGLGNLLTSLGPTMLLWRFLLARSDRRRLWKAPIQ